MTLMTRFRAPTAATLVFLALVGCAGPSAQDPTETAAGTTSALPSRPAAEASPVAVPSDEGETVTGEVPEDLLANILADAAGRSGQPPDALEVVTAQAMSWNDGSLGCPEPGMVYTQALVDGYQVVIRAAEEELDYRAGNGGFRLCENPMAPATKPSG
jgi:hypothetical protein